MEITTRTSIRVKPTHLFVRGLDIRYSLSDELESETIGPCKIGDVCCSPGRRDFRVRVLASRPEGRGPCRAGQPFRCERLPESRFLAAEPGPPRGVGATACAREGRSALRSPWLRLNPSPSEHSAPIGVHAGQRAASPSARRHRRRTTRSRERDTGSFGSRPRRRNHPVSELRGARPRLLRELLHASCIL